MNETINNEKKTGYVAHLDMLGFKKAVERDPKRAWKALNCLWDLHLEIPKQEIPIKSTGKVLKGHVKAIFNSDTIVFYTNEANEEDFFSIIVCSAKFFGRSLRDCCIPLRGGIAHGDFLVDPGRNLYTGIPFIKAYDIGEKAKWFGIVIDRTVLTPKDISQISSYPVYVEWDVPLKDGKTERNIVVNWPLIFRDHLHVPSSAKELYEGAFKHLFGPYDLLTGDVKCKYQNTLDFMKAQLNKL